MIGLALFWVAFPAYKKNDKAEQERIKAMQQAKLVHQKCEALNNEVRGLQSDPKAIERVAREKYNLAKPGEIIYRYDDRPGDARKKVEEEK